MFLGQCVFGVERQRSQSGRMKPLNAQNDSSDSNGSNGANGSNGLLLPVFFLFPRPVELDHAEKLFGLAVLGVH